MNSSTHTADHNGHAPPPIARDAPSVNALAAPLVAQLLADAARHVYDVVRATDFRNVLIAGA
ncbi:hypothetical protein BZM27_45125, partial [Paraburkholderia steynii]